MSKISIALQTALSVPVSWKSCSFFLFVCVFFFPQKYSKYSPFPPPTHLSYNHFIFQTDFNFPLYTEV